MQECGNRSAETSDWLTPKSRGSDGKRSQLTGGDTNMHIQPCGVIKQVEVECQQCRGVFPVQTLLFFAQLVGPNFRYPQGVTFNTEDEIL